MFPGLRLGYLVADQRSSSGNTVLAKTLSKVKSLLTVNTPPLIQALAAGVLMSCGGSLEPLVAPKRARYKQQRDAMVSALDDAFSPVDGITWNRPAGGFLLSLPLPFAFATAE